MKLVIVESPAKAKTIGKYLGSDYKVDASGGHISDLPEKALGVDVENNFEPEYIITSSKKALIKRLKEEAKNADEIWLATDPDREGEAISWHLQRVLKLDPKAKNRIQFNEITKSAVQKAIKNPREIDMNLVDAQQARRVLDRLVGYKLSPVLCKKIKGKLSAGRVQSSALKIIVDREKEIKAFIPEEYWSVSALLQKTTDKDKNIKFKALLAEKDGKKFKLSNKEQTDVVLSAIDGKQFVVDSVKKGTTLSQPMPPFTTSTMQQDASSKLSMASKVTMQTAQKLYEGIDVKGMGHIALVTYIRTDSVRVSDDAQNAARDYLSANYGKQYGPSKPNVYKSKKNIQDAHEAIRPVNLELTPEMMQDKLPRNEYRLYKLIYERFLASQSTPAKFDTVSAVIKADAYGFKVSGKTLVFDGYQRIYGVVAKEKDDEENAKLPNIEIGHELKCVEIKPEQKFTKAPSRYTESTLIKTMEEEGIGRPSTYAATLATLYTRTYVVKEGKALVPTDLGIVVTDYLEKYFENIVDTEFTANMEELLDEIETKGHDWKKIIGDFYGPFHKKILSAMNSNEKVELGDEVSDVVCEKCGAMMIYKTGRFGKYLACPNYPECKNTKSLVERQPDVVTEVVCDKCGGFMLEKTGRFGKYLACQNYPECQNIKSINKVVGKCPDCGGDVLERKSKKGNVFYGCANYPECKFVSWDIPTGTKCPDCGQHLVKKVQRDKTTLIMCSNRECHYKAEEKNEN
ncbi:MAG: type I DNA topoisomerase [Clostridia bacterium]|nr:type I DNA topoisomerase [Clostridia bacterium]